MRIEIDADRCSGQGRCYVLAPSLFSADAEGFNAAVGTTVDVPAGLEGDAQVAIDNCPERALTKVGTG